MNERLSPSDMSSLLAERGPIHVHVGATIVVEGEPPRFDDLVEHVDKRLALVPRFRQRVTPAALDLVNPIWTDDPGFDLRWHVRRAALPRPGGLEELRELAGRIMSEPLDFTRPLWQLYLVEGLERGRHAYVNKTHHALVDGVAAVDVATVILDPSPEGVEIEIEGERSDVDEPSPEMLLVRGASRRIREPLQAARKATLGAITMPRSTASRVVRTAESFAKLAASGPTAPRTFINVEIGRDRRVAYVAAELDGLKSARGDSGRNRQRRDPLGRRGLPAALLRAPRRAGARAPGGAGAHERAPTGGGARARQPHRDAAGAAAGGRGGSVGEA